jgi:hypothetical protein
MDDETFLRHMEARHAEHMTLDVKPEPGMDHRRLQARPTWDVYHRALHKFEMSGQEHFHRRRRG